MKVTIISVADKPNEHVYIDQMVLAIKRCILLWLTVLMDILCSKQYIQTSLDVLKDIIGMDLFLDSLKK